MQFIQTQSALAACCQRWADAPTLALDTEFVRVDTYHPQLCLLQVGDGNEPAVIDTLAVQDLEPLLELLFSSAHVKIFHAASQDLEIFASLRNAPLVPLFDTQVAAEMLGDGDQLGYAGLVEKRFGITLDKSLTRTDWARRPLRQAELEYAAADVTHLWKLHPLLREDLARRKRLKWLEEDCARMADPGRYHTSPDDAWRRLKGISRLPPAQRGTAAALARWREETARHANRPRRWILADDAIYTLAQRQPANAAQLETLDALPRKTLRAHGAELLEVVAAAAAQQTESPAAAEPPLNAAQKARFNSLRQQLGACAEQLGIPRGLLANRADIEQLARQGTAADIALTHGWRSDAAAEVLATLDSPSASTP